MSDVFYFKSQKDDQTYKLSCTNKAIIKRSASVTKTKVESGKSITDNYVLDNRTVTFDGLITDISSPRNPNMSTEQWLNEIEALRSEVPPPLLDVTVENQVVTNCLIVDQVISKTALEGKKAWRCSMVFQEVEFSERARLVEVKEARAVVKDDTDPNSKSSGSSTEQVDEALSTTVGLDITGGGFNYLTGGGS